MFNFNLKDKIFSYENKNADYDFEKIKNKTSNLNLVNSSEILNFLVGKEGIIELIEKTHLLIKDYFPEAELYLKLHDDPEYDEEEYTYALI